MQHTLTYLCSCVVVAPVGTQVILSSDVLREACAVNQGAAVWMCVMARGVQAYPDLEAQLANLDTFNVEAEGWCSVVGFAC